MATKLVYRFEAGATEGRSSMKDLLGGKGANLAEMTRIGIPVPPGFTLSTTACNLYYERERKIPKELKSQVDRALARLQKTTGKQFGDPLNPLLVSVRSGAKFSMPGMMDTILNLGLNDQAVLGLAAASGDERFAWDSYRRFIQMYADVVLEINKDRFELILASLKKRKKAKLDTDLTATDLQQLVASYKQLVCKESGKPFPQDAVKQLWGAISAVFSSWNNNRAITYRRQYGISDALGTAVNIQSMVFGNLGNDCATGVAFTRNPASGANQLYGEFLVNAQGEDVVAGIRTPQPISKEKKATGDSLEELMPTSYRELQGIRKKLEAHYLDMQDVEFTIERGSLYMLQTRTGKRTGLAALNIAFDLLKARTIDRTELLRRIEPDMLVQLLAPIFQSREVDAAKRNGRMCGSGLPAGPGAAAGEAVFTAERAERMRAEGKAVILVRNETSPEDIGGMLAAEGILTSRGGMTSHAAVVARGMGKPCVVGAEAVRVDEYHGVMEAGGVRIKEGDPISIDGTSGEIYTGVLKPFPSKIQQALASGKKSAKQSTLFLRFERLMRWADQAKRLTVRTNADTPQDAALARALGAKGIGLCRTEHMFFGEDRIQVVREMILAEDDRQRATALKRLLPMQRKDFTGIFKAMDGLPVTIRLLDPPLHEFLPTERAQYAEIAKQTGRPVKSISEKVESLAELNPMLGHRGCRLGITFPEVYEMQAQAIFEAATTCKRRGIVVKPEVMIPLVGTVKEFEILETRIRAVADRVAKKTGVRVRYQVGTMIEIPRACLVADEIAERAEFFSFGTNDLTQLTFGYSRDDVAKFLPDYIERQILDRDPFQSLDVHGVGKLVEMGIKLGRSGRPGLKVGVCGEHGGDPASVHYFHRCGADYVSCSPYRVPVARLAAAHAALFGDQIAGTA